MAYLPDRTTDDQAKITADFLPSGFMWSWKRILSHDGFKWLRGVSKSFGRIEGVLNTWMEWVDITQSTHALAEWERCTGIPDGDFPGYGTDANRQKHVITKMCGEDIVTPEDIEWLCDKIGLFVGVYPGKFFFDNPDPRVGVFEDEEQAMFTIVIELFPDLSDDDAITTFPLPFPIEFGVNNFGVMRKFILQCVPSYVDVLWIIADMETWINTSDSDEIKINTNDSDDIIQQTTFDDS